MVLTIDLDPRTEERLRVQAEAAGKDVRQHVTEIVTQAASKPALDEILAPLRKQLAESNIGDHDPLRDITDARDDRPAL
jgi:hypothetical protein